MRVLIVGGTRFIGAATARRLAEIGHDVTVLHRGETPGELPEGIQHLVGERGNLATSREAIQRLAPDVALHTIAMTERDAQEAVDELRGVARRLVVLSSEDVYRAYGRLILTEPGPPDPVPLTEE